MTRCNDHCSRFLAALLLVAPLACAEVTIDPAGGGNAGGASAGGGSVGGANAGGAGAGAAAGGGQVGGGEVGGNAAGGGGVQPPTEIATCGGTAYDCGDLVDNDNDGLLDSVDPDCLGPCDNTEDSYYPDLPSSDPECKLDCYWDAGAGSGDDECYWSYECDTHSVAPDYYPAPSVNCPYAGEDVTMNPPGQTCGDLYTTQSEQCLSFCGPLTPNGCDCFGCCELPALSGSFVFVGSVGLDEATECTPAGLSNPDLCHPCRPVPACLNDCGPCEICVGRPEPEPGCEEGGGGPQCPEGVQACGVSGQDPCPSGYTCITGCCYAFD